MNQTYYKCVNKTADKVYTDFKNESINNNIDGAYCALTDYKDALQLLRDWEEDAIECKTPLVYNCILKVESNISTKIGYNGLCCNGTKWIGAYNILQEVLVI